jgi:hypothetical protein
VPVPTTFAFWDREYYVIYHDDAESEMPSSYTDAHTLFKLLALALHFFYNGRMMACG